MSITLNSLASAGCGCPSVTPVKPENLAIVPQGSTIVQAPCAENCAPPSSSALSGIQPGGSTSSCRELRNPCVDQNFVVAALEKQGQFFAECAASWAMPGLRLFFGGLGYLEVTGVSGNVVSYRNLTIEPGTEILAGTCFHHDGPPVVTASEEDGGAFEESASTLDAIYGEDGNVRKKIVPVNGMMLFACGGKWQRRQAGLMFYPATRTLLWNQNVSAQNLTTTVSLPNLPTASDCSLGLWGVFSVELFTIGLTASVSVQGHVRINNIPVLRCVDEAAGNGAINMNTTMVSVGKGATTAELKLTVDNGNGSENGSASGYAKVCVFLEGYMH